MKKVILCFFMCLAFISCRENLQTNLGFMRKIQINPRADETAEKIKLLNNSISTHKTKKAVFYYSNGETFQNFDGYTFYITPYLIQESSLVYRVSMRIYVKSVTNKKNVFKTLTIFDDKKNRVTFTFNEIKRKVENDDFLITESSDTLIDFNQIEVLQKLIDSKNIYAVFHGEKKYTFKMNRNLRESFLNIIRKYKLLTSKTMLTK